MATKTNKSYTKRIKITKKGKMLSRKPGQNHFNAKEDRESQLDKKGWNVFRMKNKKIAQFIPNKAGKIIKAKTPNAGEAK
jgi:ribosomal protein L35